MHLSEYWTEIAEGKRPVNDMTIELIDSWDT